jgi:NAD(P)-dependent dehydrogenase (short-subunit alcohol dehydrogenase family)
VNNAAIFSFAPTLEQDIDSLDMMFDTNVRGPFFLTAALLPMTQGAIVFPVDLLAHI